MGRGVSAPPEPSQGEGERRWAELESAQGLTPPVLGGFREAWGSALAVAGGVGPSVQGAVFEHL